MGCPIFRVKRMDTSRWNVLHRLTAGPELGNRGNGFEESVSLVAASSTTCVSKMNSMHHVVSKYRSSALRVGKIQCARMYPLVPPKSNFTTVSGPWVTSFTLGNFRVVKPSTSRDWNPLPALLPALHWSKDTLMGTASSKAARVASAASQRKYPLRPSPSTRETQQAPQSSIPQEDLQPRAAAEVQARHGLRGERPSENKSDGRFTHSPLLLFWRERLLFPQLSVHYLFMT